MRKNKNQSAVGIVYRKLIFCLQYNTAHTVWHSSWSLAKNRHFPLKACVATNRDKSRYGGVLLCFARIKLHKDERSFGWSAKRLFAPHLQWNSVFFLDLLDHVTRIKIRVQSVDLVYSRLKLASTLGRTVKSQKSTKLAKLLKMADSESCQKTNYGESFALTTILCKQS